MEKNRTNGLLSEHYLHYLLKEAARSDRQMVDLHGDWTIWRSIAIIQQTRQRKFTWQRDGCILSESRTMQQGLTTVIARLNWSLGDRRNSQCRIQNSFGNTGKSNN